METAITSLGIPTILGVLLYVGRKLQVLNDMQATQEKIKINLKVVCDHLISNSKKFTHKELQTYSPLKLTNAGRKLVKTLNFDAIFEHHRQDFFGYIDGEEPKLKYDVENAAIRSISVLYDQDYMTPLKIFFYNQPDRDLPNVAPTLGVYVRDKYLVEHPEITE